MKQILSLILLLTFTLAFGQEYKYVNIGTLNIREGSGTEYEVVGKTHKGEKIIILSDGNGWSKIKTENGIEGYVSSKYLTESEVEKNKTKEDNDDGWSEVLIGLGIIIYIGYRVKKRFSGIFGNSSALSSRNTRTNPTTAKSKPREITIYLLSIKDGVVNLGKERSNMRQSVFNYFDKAIDCDLEDQSDDRSRFLVVTTKGEVILCQLKSTGKKVVFRPFVSYGSAYKTRFSGRDAFTFQTEKGTYKGYFNSTKIEKIA